MVAEDGMKLLPDRIVVAPGEAHLLVDEVGGKLVVRFSKTAELVGDVEPWQHDTFVVRWRERWLNADAFLNFVLDADGHIREARMEPISPLTDFSFDFQDLRLAPVEKK